MDVVVTYEDWHVGDGDPPIAVGEPWVVTIDLQRAGPVTSRDWHPQLRPSSQPATWLRPVDGLPAEHELVGDVVASFDHECGGPWAAIRVGPWRLAAAGELAGRVAGRVVPRYDTHMIDDEELRAFATQQVEVMVIHYLAGRYRRLRRGDHERVGWDPPVPLPDTHAMGTSMAPGMFLITCRQPA